MLTNEINSVLLGFWRKNQVHDIEQNIIHAQQQQQHYQHPQVVTNITQTEVINNSTKMTVCKTMLINKTVIAVDRCSAEDDKRDDDEDVFHDDGHGDQRDRGTEAAQAEEQRFAYSCLCESQHWQLFRGCVAMIQSQTGEIHRKDVSMIAHTDSVHPQGKLTAMSKCSVHTWLTTITDTKK